jgi:bifunctional enzyme Fae/Hps
MLDKKKKYLQIALNSTVHEAQKVISKIPLDERIIIEAGTPLIKAYGARGISAIKNAWQSRVFGKVPPPMQLSPVAKAIFQQIEKRRSFKKETLLSPYIVADLKCMDRGFREVEIAKNAGASAATVLGHAPIETIDAFVSKCKELGIDSMIDTMNLEFPLNVLRKLKQLPEVVILHRGVDEEDYNKEKQIPYHEIQRIKNQYNIMIAVAGGDTQREVQTAVFNDIDIVILWRDFFQGTDETIKLTEQFLREVR